MLSRLKAALAAATIFASQPALATGTIPLAMSVQVDTHGNLAAGCQLSFFVAGTVATPQNAYQDFGLNTPTANPLSCDQSGRLPMFWLADGLIHVRLTDSTGISIIDTTMQVLGPSSGGGGGGGTVDPTTLMATGDIKLRYGTGGLTGFVRDNGLSIGNSTSGATERANADTQNLFIYLYNTDPNLVVSGGRTGNALNDYNASKTIALPDMRGRVPTGLADMGNTATSIFTALYAGCSSVTTLGAGCGSQNHTLVLGELPTGITSTLNGATASGAGGLPLVYSTATVSDLFISTGASGPAATNAGGAFAGTAAAPVTGSATSNNTTGNPHATVSPGLLMTFYQKL